MAAFCVLVGTAQGVLPACQEASDPIHLSAPRLDAGTTSASIFGALIVCGRLWTVRQRYAGRMADAAGYGHGQLRIRGHGAASVCKISKVEYKYQSICLHVEAALHD